VEASLAGMTTINGGKELVDLFNKVNFTENDFRGRKTTRLAQLSFLQENGDVDNKMKISKLIN
jgi:hypothetical protein